MPKKIKIEAVVPAAGLGIRLKNRILKPFVKIGGLPLIIHTLRALDSHHNIDKIIVLARRTSIKKIKALAVLNKIKKIKYVIEGGLSRKQSVGNGLALLDKDTDFVLVHDAARPFIEKKVISDVIQKARKYGSAVCGVPLKPTVKRVSAAGGSASGGKDKSLAGKEIFVAQTLDRRNIWEIQTPQVFKKDLILKAHKISREIDTTDDAYLVERLGKNVAVTDGSYFNIKVTTPEDLVFAQAILRVQNAKRKM